DYCIARTVARGNLVPATHGETVFKEQLRGLADEQKAIVQAEIAARNPLQRVPRQRLRLARAPLAHLDPQTVRLGEPLPSVAPPATEATAFTARAPRSVSTLQVEVEGVRWQERSTLLESRPDEPVFRVEIDDTGEA